MFCLVLNALKKAKHIIGGLIMKYKYELPKLPYSYSALEPYIDEETMMIHHDKHHGTYVNNLNAALEGYPELQERTLEDLLTNLNTVPKAVQTAVRNNGGGHYNHTLFWESMGPNAGGKPTGVLAERINRDFGSFENFKETLSKAALTRFGSGWGWLVEDDKGILSVVSTANQDTPLSEGYNPLLLIDVWEHAYYLKYQNKRGDYISAWWNLINWANIAKRLKK